MSGTQPLPRLHIDQPNALSIDTPRADFGRVFDRRTRRVGHAEWNGQYGWIVFTPDQTQPHLPGWPHQPGVNDDDAVTLSFKAGRFIPLDHPDLYALVGIAIQGDRLDAIKRARVVFDLGLAEAKSLIESVLNEGAERGPITGVTLKDGRTVVVRQQDDDEAKERERRSMEALRATDDLRAKDMDDAFKFRDYLDIPPRSAMSPEVRAKLDEAVAKFQALPAVQAQIRVMSAPTPISISGATTNPADGYAVDIRTNTTQLLEYNPPEPNGPLRMETLKARAKTGTDLELRFMTADDFKDAIMDWSLNPTSEKYEKLRQAGAACGLGPDEQIKAANERAYAAEESAKRLQAVLDAETGRKGLEGWVYSYVFRDMVDNTAWRLDLSGGRCVVAWGRRMDGSDKYEESNPGGWAIWILNADGELDEEYGVGGNDPVWNALDAMEHATRRLRELGLLAQATPSP